MNSKSVLIAAALLGAVTTAQARPHHGHGVDDDSNYRGKHGRAVHYRDTAKVVDVDPIVSWRQVEVKRRVCKPRRGHRHDEYSDKRRYDGNGDYLVPTVIGGVVGGVLGSQVEDRGVRVATTAAGSAVGALVGYGLSQANYQTVDHRDHRHGHNHGKKCRTVTEYERRRHVDGYRVTYRYRGREFVTRTDEHPGRRIPVKVKLRPDY